MKPRLHIVLPSWAALLGVAVLIGQSHAVLAEDGATVVPWMSVPAAVRGAVNESSPAGSSVGRVEKKTVGGQEVYDVHLKIAGGGADKVIEMDKNGARTEAAAPAAPAEPEEPKAAEAPVAPPRPEKTGLEGFGDGPAEGNAEGEYQAGQHSEYGSSGERQDYAAAATWYKKAATDGSAAAAFSLASLYADGRGVKQDNAEAAGWYRKAAERSHADAQYNLGQFYAKGLGVPRDDAAAWFWFSLAANNRNANAVAARDAAAARLAPDQLAAAQKRLQNWKPVAAIAAAPAAPVAVGITPPPVSDVMPQMMKPHPAAPPPAAAAAPPSP